MTRTIPAGLTADFAARQFTLARCLRLDLRDGTTFGITTHDLDLLVNLGDGALTYEAGTGVLPSAVSLSLGLEADNLEARGPLGDLVTREQVLGGRLRGARARLFDVNWLAPSEIIRLLQGKVTDTRIEGGEFVLEVRSNFDAYNQTIGRVLGPYCSHDFGVDDPPRSRCQAVPEQWSGQIVAVVDAMTFVVAWTTSPAPTDVTVLLNGLMAFDDGDLLGVPPIEVFAVTETTAGVMIEVYQPFPEAPQVGDAFTVDEGCDKTRPTCKLKGQILNFGGFPDLVGTDAYVKYPVPGQG